jgi:hypothetical protein
MPYKDPERRRQADRDRKRRKRSLVAVSDLEGALPDPPSRDELLRILGVMARNGQVTAIRLLLDELRRDENTDEPGGVIDELARKRSGAA